MLRISIAKKDFIVDCLFQDNNYLEVCFTWRFAPYMLFELFYIDIRILTFSKLLEDGKFFIIKVGSFTLIPFIESM